MANALTPVKFHGATLVTINIDGVAYVALKPICEAIGLDWSAQLNRIKRHPVLSTCMVVTTMQVPGDAQTRETVCLPLTKLNGWLFGVNSSRAKPELREKLVQYQHECFEVLASHFLAVPPAQALPPPAEPTINVRELLLGGQSEPVALTAAQQSAINRHAWMLSHEVYELVRQHTERRVAFSTTSDMRMQPGRVEELLASITLGGALAHRYHQELRSVLKAMQLAKMFADDVVVELQKVVFAIQQPEQKDSK